MIRWLLIGLVLAAPARAEDLTVLTAGAFKTVATALIPEYEAASGNKITLRNDTVGALVKRIQDGEAFDVVLMSPIGMRDIAQAGKIAKSSEVAIAKVGIGVAVKAGSAKLDISTVPAFKAVMQQARSVAYIDPASGGSSGIYIVQLFQRLGIADAMAMKSVLIKGGLAAEAVADGRADVVIQQISEIKSVAGVALVGALPADIQHETSYDGAISATAKAPDAARSFLAALSSPAARTVLCEKGMAPPGVACP